MDLFGLLYVAQFINISIHVGHDGLTQRSVDKGTTRNDSMVTVIPAVKVSYCNKSFLLSQSINFSTVIAMFCTAILN